MKILIDAMGGDNAPLEIIKGASMASRKCKNGESICLVGQEDAIRRIAGDNNISLEEIEIYNANDVVKMDDSPLSVRNKPESSLRVGFDLLKKGEVDAFVSAGSTGALHTGASLYIGKTENIRRGAIGTILPLNNPTLLIDSGANTVLTPEHLVEFAIMGSTYMKEMFGIEKPRVGLLNIGVEETKGTELQKKAYEILKNAPVYFIGNIEANAASEGECDVLVCDGFSGNIFLKSIEGIGKLIFGKLKTIFSSNAKNKLSYLILKDEIHRFKMEFDPSEYGGAPIFGISKPVIKAHGSSDAKEIMNSVFWAANWARLDLTSKMDEECKKYYDKEKNQ